MKKNVTLPRNNIANRIRLLKGYNGLEDRESKYEQLKSILK